MRILFPASEVVPFSKTGGLADVSGALPHALAARGHEVRIVTPLYRSVSREGLREGRLLSLEFPFGGIEVRTWERVLADRVTIVFVDVPAFFDRAQLYGDPSDYADNARRFTTLTMAALTDAQAAGFVPDIVHCHDWQTGLAPLALKRGYASVFPHAKSVLTVHNLAYQGGFQKSALPDLGIPWSDFTPGGVEYWDHLSMLKAGIVFADAVTTVSPTYAKEISTSAGGMGLDGVLRAKPDGVIGIVNGIDTDEWSPATDVYLPARFSDVDLEGRAVCRAKLLEEARLPPPSHGMPLFGVIGRMVEQKGADLLHAALPVFLEHGASVVVLGSGNASLEKGWKLLEARYPMRCSVKVGYDTGLAHLIEAGSDFFLMPSRFEPCGLNQMYSQRYGCIPIVHGVGGLLDTVADVRGGEGTGIVFHGATVDAVQGALRRALELFHSPAQLEQVRQRGMRRDFSWAGSAALYERVYSHVMGA
ncbi:MAG: glycogen synthase GlgA [Archangium sp.]|nr:glycogen synthase GlgA [Archangium sp.]